MTKPVDPDELLRHRPPGNQATLTSQQHKAYLAPDETRFTRPAAGERTALLFALPDLPSFTDRLALGAGERACDLRSTGVGFDLNKIASL